MLLLQLRPHPPSAAQVDQLCPYESCYHMSLHFSSMCAHAAAATVRPSLSLLPAQVNHLGPYTLTRLLEKKLVASKARVVNVVSVTHRITTIK